MNPLVMCDWCDEDYTNSDECGGLLMQSKACCPKCVPEVEKLARQYDEEQYITRYCPEGMPFRTWVVTMLR